MAQVNLPSPLVSHTPALGSDVLANDEAITAQVNGNLDATNVTTATPASQTGAASAQGGASTLLRSDMQLAIQGFEQLASDPGSPAVAQLWYNTGSNQIRGSNDGATVKAVWPLGASDLPTHGSNHSTGGSDPLAGGAVDQTMLAQKTIVAGVPSGDVTVLQAWTDVITGMSITCGVAQTLQMSARCAVWNTGGSSPDPGVAIGVFEVISGVDTFVDGTQYFPIDVAGTLDAGHTSVGARVNIDLTFPVNVAAGTHTYKLKAVKSDPGGILLAKVSQGVGGTTVPVTRMTIRVA